MNVELAEKDQTVKNVKTAQNAKSKSAINTWVNILEIIKNNRAKSKKIAVEVYMVEAEIEEIDVEKQEAGTTALTGPPNTKNDVDVDTAKKTQVKKAAKTTLATNTEATNHHQVRETKLLRSAPTINFSKNIDVKTDEKAQVEKAAKATLFA
jgi:hypothetical protein